MSHIQCRICIPQVAISRLFSQYYVLFALSGPLLSPTNYQSKRVSQVVNLSSSKFLICHQANYSSTKSSRRWHWLPWDLGARDSGRRHRHCQDQPRYTGELDLWWQKIIRDGAAPPFELLVLPHCLLSGMYADIHRYIIRTLDDDGQLDLSKGKDEWIIPAYLLDCYEY